MKKLIQMICIFSLLLAHSVTVTAELQSEEDGVIQNTIVFDDILEEESSSDEKEQDTSETEKKKSVGGSLGSGVLQKKKEEPVENLQEETETENEEEAEVVSNPFADVLNTDWFYDDVLYAYQNGIMSGVNEKSFAPQTGVTRAMFITILYRTAGEPETAGTEFSDVVLGSWYEKAVSWGAEQKIVSGTGNGQFSPDAGITREQLAVMLYNYRKATTQADETTDISSYQDSDEVSAWATEAVSWAVANGIITGKSAGVLAPTAGATRAEAAAIVRRFLKLLEEV